MTKTLPFDMLTVGDTFTFHGGTGTFKKLSARRAQIVEETTPPFSMRAQQVVTVTLPDPAPPTPEELAERRERDLLDRARSMARYAEETLAEWRVMCANNPLYAFQWADDAMKAAARLHVGALVQAKLAAGHPLQNLVEHATEQVMSGARYPTSSTSPARNAMDTYVTAAWAEWLRS